MPRRDGPPDARDIAGRLEISGSLGPPALGWMEMPDEITIDVGGRPLTFLADTPERRAAGELAAACREMLKAMESLATDGGDFYEESAARRDAEMLRAALAAIDGAEGED